jgi:DNA-3-methyladenine glycosylase
VGRDRGSKLTRLTNRLTRSFFNRPVLSVAPDLLGCVVRHSTPEGVVAVRLTEVEAYAGEGEDPASHAHRGRTRRNDPMFADAGTLYVYFTYGMHWCANITCEPRGRAAAVLLRAGEVVEGLPLARSRRPAARGAVELARGPARMAVALGIDGTMDGLDFCARSSVLRVHQGSPPPIPPIRSGPRVGVSGSGAQTPWRFWFEGEPSVSRWRPGREGAPR